jgi:type I restriction enzyme S subunit
MEERDLPVGWASIELIDAGIWGSGGTPSRKNPRYYENGHIPWLVIGDLNDQPVEEFSTSITELGLIDSSAKLIPTGSLLVAMYGSIGKLGITTFPCTTNQAIAFCIPDEELVALRYLFHALANAKPELIAKGQGGAQQNISQGILKEHLIPLAPLNEQHRIVAKLDTTLAAVEACRQRLDGVAAILKRFRQAVLAAATSGELTREWREKKGQVFEWLDVQLGEHAESMNYGTSAKSQREGEVPVLRMGNLQGGDLDWTELAYTSDLAEIAKYLLDDGDVLFNRTNSPELVGKTAMYRGERPAIYAGYLIRVRCRPSLDPEFLNLSLNSPAARDYCWRVKSDGVSQSNINAKKLAAYPFLLPSVEEQEEIVRRAQELFSLADQLEARLTAAREIVDRLTPSLLAKAFRGELVPQDPNDEPASDLLAKLKANKSNAAGESPRRRSNSSKKRRTMSITDKDSIKAVILSLRTIRFSFDELRAQAGGDYESLRAVLFELLEEPSPVVRQVFDQEAKVIKLERIRP